MPSAFASTGNHVLSSLRTDDLHVDLPKRLQGLLRLPGLNSKLIEQPLTPGAEGFQLRAGNG